MNKTKVIILIAFVLAMGAGVAVGMLTSRNLPQPSGKGGWLIQELGLDATQERQMHEIWTAIVQTKGREFAQERWALQLEREAAIKDLLDASQKERYEQINQQFVQRGRDLWKRFEQEFLAASERTRKILNDSQREKYDKLVAKFQADRANGDFFGPGMGGPMGRGPSTRPDGVQPTH